MTSPKGQYDLVLKNELPRILDAFKLFKQGSYRPDLTIVICGKRHHARNYPTGQDHATPNGNTPPGTVIDKGITDVYGNDFYLQVRDVSSFIMLLAKHPGRIGSQRSSWSCKTHPLLRALR